MDKLKIQMDINKSQQMENWKKLMIMDPLLNNIFDHSINIKDFLHDKILTQDHQQIVHTYTKLSSIKHSLSKQIQKQVQSKHQVIEKSFLSRHKLSKSFHIQNETQMIKSLKSIESFNSNYEKVKENTIKLENINKILKFSKALEKFKINCRLLKTFMKDHYALKDSVGKQEQEKIKTSSSNRNVNNSSSNESLNLLKVSKLIKQLTELMSKNDFTGIKYYETQKQFISNSKAILYSLAQKQLTKTIQKYQQLIIDQFSNKQTSTQLIFPQRYQTIQDQIKQKLRILHSVNKLKDFILGFAKKILQQTGNVLKQLFEKLSVEEFKNYFLAKVFVSVLSNSIVLIRIEEILVESMLSKHLLSANLPNLFEKYVERLVAYFTDLINWKLEQDNKQSQKKKSLSENKVLSEIKQIFQSKNIKLKVPLVYKYPVFYGCLASLVTKIHEQVLARAEYNKLHYQFSIKKSQIMTTLLPISKKFYQIFEEVIKFNRTVPESNDSKFQSQNMLKIECLKHLYKQFISNQNENQGKTSKRPFQFDKNELGILIQTLNEKIINQLQLLIGIDLNQGNQVHSRQNAISNNLKSNLSSFEMTREVIRIVDVKQLLKLYSNLENVINHIKRIKQMKKIIQIGNNPQISIQNRNNIQKAHQEQQPV